MYGNVYFEGFIVLRISKPTDGIMQRTAQSIDTFLNAPENGFATKMKEEPSLTIITVEWKE
jgi:hypothetical protein